jgi:hypothetical protein
MAWRGLDPGPCRYAQPPMFVFFSNRLGRFGSLVVSLVATAILLLALGVIRLRPAGPLHAPCWARTSDPQLVELVLYQLS